MEITALAKAKELGLTRYFTGKPCKNGHIAERLTSCSHCVVCHVAASTKAHKKRYQNDPEYRAKVIEKQMVRYQEQRQVINERRRSYTARTIERARDRQRKYRAEKPDVYRAYVRNRRAKIRAAGGTHTAEDIQALFQLQRGRCACCGSKLTRFEVDHIKAIARGGTNGPLNLQLLCPNCNRRKGAKDEVTWAQELGRLL